jgi:hypothetical protein
LRRNRDGCEDTFGPNISARSSFAQVVAQKLFRDFDLFRILLAELMGYDFETRVTTRNITEETSPELRCVTIAAQGFFIARHGCTGRASRANAKRQIMGPPCLGPALESVKRITTSPV